MATAVDTLAAIRAFNRFELKYLIDFEQIESVRADLASRLQPDPHQPDGSYPVWSLYYDTPDRKFYWEKVDGIKFRRKLRIRHYGNPDQLRPESKVFVEIKQRVNRVTQKRRVATSYADALSLCNDHLRLEMPDRQSQSVVDEVLRLAAGLDLEPAAITGYQRLAMSGKETDGGLRITFDTHLRGRTSDLELHSAVETPPILDARLAIVEVKVNERVPYWLTDKVATHNMQLIRVSKYCTSVEGIAPAALRVQGEGTA